MSNMHMPPKLDLSAHSYFGSIGAKPLGNMAQVAYDAWYDMYIAPMFAEAVEMECIQRLHPSEDSQAWQAKEKLTDIPATHTALLINIKPKESL